MQATDRTVFLLPDNEYAKVFTVVRFGKKLLSKCAEILLGKIQ